MICGEERLGTIADGNSDRGNFSQKKFTTIEQSLLGDTGTDLGRDWAQGVVVPVRRGRLVSDTGVIDGRNGHIGRCGVLPEKERDRGELWL
jgi:hypothetical protein